MARKTWTLSDVDAGVYLEELSLGPDQVGGRARGYRVTKRTLRGGLSDGVDLVEVDNGRFRFVVVPTRGMGLWRASCGEVPLGWKSPAKGPVHPAFVPLWQADGLGWLKGFDELLVRCGLESNGGPDFDAGGKLRSPLHGRIANIPAHKVEVAIDGDSGEIVVTGVVEEAHIYGNKMRLTTTLRTKVGQPGVTVVDEVTNISAQPGELELLYHINFGMPLVTPGARVMVPVKRLAPRDAVAVVDVPTWNVYGPESPGLTEVCHFFDLAADSDGNTLAVLRSADGSQGVSVRVQQAAVALLHDLEEPPSGHRRLRHRPGARDELSQPEIVREGPRPRGGDGGGRNAAFRDCHRGPRRCRRRESRRTGCGRDPRQRQAGNLRQARSQLGTVIIAAHQCTVNRV